MKFKEKKAGSLVSLLQKYDYDVYLVHRKSGVPINRIENCKAIMLRNQAL